MLKFKGVYEWELRNADTGEVDAKGKQWNVISDKFLEWMFFGNSTSYAGGGLSTSGMAIQLSDSVPTVGVDYRRAGRSNTFNILVTGSIVQYNVDFVNMSKYTYHNFPPPGATRTIRVIGIKIFQSSYDVMLQPNFVSFIELSTPITQNTNQYLYVKYTVFITPNLSAGYNTPNNRYINYGFNSAAFCPDMYNLGTWFTSNTSTVPVRVTDLLPPSDINKVQRNVPFLYRSTNADVRNHLGMVYGNYYLRSFAVSEMVGPMGTIAYVNDTDYTKSPNTDHYGYFNTTYGYSPINSVTPSVSRVYVHPAGREAYIFSDPSYPATSQGTVLISGTPTNKYPALSRIKITKTGDASDLVDETVSYTAVDIGANSITVTQDIATGDKYRLTTTGTLPSPLIAGTDYYIIRIDATTIKLATTYAFALDGTAIDITTQGTGNHTLIRQNTGEYLLENNLWISAGMRNMTNLSMGIDFDGYVMPQNLDSTINYYTNYAEGDYIGSQTDSGQNQFYPGASASMLRGGLLNGNYIYTVQQSRKGLIPNVCRWLFNTIETSEPLCKFGSGSTIVGGVLDGGTKMYIYTNTGLYEYTFATPTVAPVLLSITGIIDNNITDACIDPVTGYLWTGHTTGLSRINLGTLTATQYLTGTGQALEGMTAAEVYIWGGQLDAYNGRVLRGGTPNVSGSNNVAWVMDDGVGYYRVKTTTNCQTCCIRRGTTQVVYSDQRNLQVFNVTVTGKNTGTSTQIETFAISSGTVYYASQLWGHLAQINSDTFVYFYVTPQISSNYYITFAHYKLGALPLLWYFYSGSGSGAPVTVSSRSHATYGYALAAFRRCPMNIDGSGLPMFLWHRYLIVTNYTLVPGSYGWDGSTWVLGNTNSRRIPKTGTHTLLNGLSVDFNNSTGGTWDTQFVSGDHYNFAYGPMFVKDNLQIVDISCRKYNCETHVVEDYAVTVPMSAPYEITIPEVSDPNFRDMDNIDFVTVVKEGSTPYTQAWGTAVTYSVNASTNIFTVNANIATGTALIVYNVGTPMYLNCPVPLNPSYTYYAINVNTTTIRLALSYADALVGTAIGILTTGTETQFYQVITPTAGTYRASGLGVFKFAAADAGKNLTLTYTYSKFTT